MQLFGINSVFNTFLMEIFLFIFERGKCLIRRRSFTSSARASHKSPQVFEHLKSSAVLLQDLGATLYGNEVLC